MNEISDQAVKASVDESKQGQKSGRFAWIMGWIVTPGIVVLLLFSSGLYMGVHQGENWLSRFALWVISLF